MTSTMHRSPSQAKREARRFEVLKAQRLQLLRALEGFLDWADDYESAGCAEVTLVWRQQARQAIRDVRSCRIVPLEES